MASREFEELRNMLKPGLAVASDPFEVVRDKMHAVHPTEYGSDVEVERIELGGIPAAWVNTPEATGVDRLRTPACSGEPHSPSLVGIMQVQCCKMGL